VVDFLLAAWLLAFAEVVVVMLLLSPGHWLSRTNLLYALYAVWAGALLVWWGLGTPKPPPFRPVLGELREALRDRLLLVLAVAVTGAFGYVAALILFTAPNDYDALWYHLARAAFWKQQHAVAYIPGVNDARMNGFPPNAEIGNGFTMILSQTDRFVGFVQLSSLAVTMVSIAGMARRIGLSARQGLFGALLFATLPVVILQSATALNDLVFCACLACCAYFLLTGTTLGFGLAALGLGLAIGTKITALLALPVLAIVGAFLYPRRRWPALVLVGIGGILIGSYWYIVNLVETGRWDGQFSPASHQTAAVHGNTYSFLGVIAHTMRLLVDSVDASGSVGRDRFLYLVAAAVVLVLGVRAGGRAGALVAAGIVAVCLALRPVQHELLHGYQKLWVQLSRPRLAFLGFDKHLTRASPFQSWYGAAGLLLVLACLVLAWRRRRELPRVALVLAVAPIVWIVLQAITTFYSLWDGRYVAFAVALAAAVWGLVLPVRPLAWAVTAIGVTAIALGLVHYDEKPSGVNVLGGSAPKSVWDLTRAQVLAKWLHPGEDQVVATLEREAKRNDRIDLVIRREDVSYPYFGSRLDRQVTFAGASHGQAFPEWQVVAPGEKPERLGGERLVVNRDGWRLYRTTPS
jgi:hypothetical protein